MRNLPRLVWSNGPFIIKASIALVAIKRESRLIRVQQKWKQSVLLTITDQVCWALVIWSSCSISKWLSPLSVVLHQFHFTLCEPWIQQKDSRPSVFGFMNLAAKGAKFKYLVEHIPSWTRYTPRTLDTLCFVYSIQFKEVKQFSIKWFKTTV